MANIEIYSGDTLELSVDVVDQNNIAVDLTGARVLWKVAKSNWKTDPTALVTKDSQVPGNIAIVDSNFVVHIKSIDTTGMPAANYYHEAQVTLIDGTIGTPLTGTFKVKPNLIDPR